MALRSSSLVSECLGEQASGNTHVTWSMGVRGLHSPGGLPPGPQLTRRVTYMRLFSLYLMGMVLQSYHEDCSSRHN